MRSVLVRSPYEGRRLFALLPDRVVNRSPRLMLDRCFLAMLFDDRQLPSLVEQAGEVLEAHGMLDEQASASYGEWLVVKGAVAYKQGDYAAARHHLAEAGRYEAKLSGLITGVQAFLQMHLKHYAGEYSAASRHARHALAAFERARFSLGVVAVRREMARWSMRRGRGEEASLRFQELFDLWQRDQLILTRDIALAYFFATEDCYWQNRLSQAQVYQAAMLTLATQLQDRELIVMARVLGEFLSVMSSGSRLALHEAPVWSEAIVTPSVEDLVRDLKVRILVAATRRDLAWENVRLLESQLNDPASQHIRIPLITYLYGYIARGHDLDVITPLLTETLAHAAAQEERFYQLQILALRVWQQRQLHGQEQIGPLLEEAIQLARETGYVRVLLDIPGLAELLPDLAPLRESAAQAAPRPAPRSDAVLTEQEVRVLALLATDRTYREIADELVISVNTVRTHVRNIYKKLSVGRRNHAIRAARRLGLLPPAPAAEPLSGASQK